jgi:hypothetical protein
VFYRSGGFLGFKVATNQSNDICLIRQKFKNDSKLIIVILIKSSIFNSRDDDDDDDDDGYINI